jgi:putative transcriptional regulator
LTPVNSKVRELRQAAGLSQAALGEAVGVSRQTINAVETGRYDPSLTLAARLARHFGSTIEEIFDVVED